MRRVNLETRPNCLNEVTFEGRTLTLTRMEPISWVPWVVGEVEDNAVFISRVVCDFSDNDVNDYFQLWCRDTRNDVTNAKAANTGRTLVHFKSCIGITYFLLLYIANSTASGGYTGGAVHQGPRPFGAHRCAVVIFFKISVVIINFTRKGGNITM